jgi:hypothetical protein
LIACGAHEPAAEPDPIASVPQGRVAEEIEARPQGEPANTAQPVPGPDISLRVSEVHLRAFLPLEEAHVPAERLGALFNAMKEKAWPYCSFKRRGGELDRDAVAEFVTDVDRYVRAGNGTKASIRAGCHNFVRMNDQRPDRDFQLIRLLNPDESFDCYSVGVMQPYMMSHELSCKTLTMLDIDWEVQHLHWQLLERYRAGQMVEEGFAESLANVEVSWPMHIESEGKVPMSMGMLCGDGQREVCRRDLLAFQSQFGPDRELETITLNLSALHDGHFEPSPRTKVLFLSNATEDIYTSWPQFVHFIKRLRSSMEVGQRAILVHHVGGRSAWGTYELRRTERGHRLKTVCKDPFENTSGFNAGSHYESWFEKMTTTKKKAQYCRPLRVAMAKREAEAQAGTGDGESP